jgi:hypothetical protein
VLSNVTASNNTGQNLGGGLSLMVSSSFNGQGSSAIGQATATVTNSSFNDNSTPPPFGGAGGIFIQITGEAGLASVSLTGVQVNGNRAAGAGGIGVQMFGEDAGAAALTVSNSSISGNTATTSDGGGISIGATTIPSLFMPPGSSTRATATVTLTQLTVEGNSSGNNGGGIEFILEPSFGATGTTVATVTACTIDGNSAVSQGGGIFAMETGSATATATLTVTNSTLFANSAFAGGGIDNFASGPDSTAGISLLSDTVAFNAASFFAGGLVANGDHFTVHSSIIADNTASLFADLNGPFTSGGHNLIGQTDGSSGFDGGDLTGTSANPLDPLFGAFGNFGGPTQTLALLAGSPAIGQGDPAGPTTDERGVFRSRTAPSIGAFEFTG